MAEDTGLTIDMKQVGTTWITGFTPQPVSDSRKKGTVLALYGPPGVGKTTLAADAYLEFGPLLFVDVEGGMQSISYLKDKVSFQPFDNWPRLEAFTDSAYKATTCPYNTIVIDNMSGIQQVNMEHQYGNRGAQIQDYSKSTSDILKFTRRWIDISERFNIIVIFILWDALITDEATDIHKQAVGLTPALSTKWAGILPLIGLVTASRKDVHNKRNISFAMSNRNSAKHRLNKEVGSLVNDLPLSFDFKEADHAILDILGLLVNNKPWPKNKYTEEVKREF